MNDLGVAGGTEALALGRKANSNDKAWGYRCITKDGIATRATQPQDTVREW
jgi:hypothetical protein